MDVLTAIRNRKSSRSFINKSVTQETVTQILKAARFAPSGVNTQPWNVVVVTGDIKQDISNKIINARETNIPENPDYSYYPKDWFEPYKSRRKECGLALYSAINIKKEDTIGRKKAWYRNYDFFEAPVGLFFFVNSKLDKGSWLDNGMFIQNVMLAAMGFGLETCPQAAMAEYPDIVRETLNIQPNNLLICGMAMGYPDSTHPLNSYRTTREPVESFTQFIGF